MRALARRSTFPLGLLVLAAMSCDPGPTPDPGAGPAEPTPGPSPPAVRDTVLEAAIRAVIADIDGEVGVAVLHLQRDTHASVHGDHPFPLASVYKLPIAYAALQDGRVAPTDSVAVESSDAAPGATPFVPGMVVPVASLVERSLAHSDNTASDVLLRVLGGPDEATRRTHALGAREVRVDRSMRQIFAEWQRGPEARAAFVQDARDTGTAEGVVTLLSGLHRGEALQPAARHILLEALRSAATGPNRIRAGVPAGTTVAHKTGSLGPLTHDAGLVTLPGDGGEVAIAVLIRSEAPAAERERVIAGIADAVWRRYASDADR